MCWNQLTWTANRIQKQIKRPSLSSTPSLVRVLKGSFLKIETRNILQAAMTWSYFLRNFGITDNPRTFEPRRKNLTMKWVNRKYHYIYIFKFHRLVQSNTLKIFRMYVLFACCLRFSFTVFQPCEFSEWGGEFFKAGVTCCFGPNFCLWCFNAKPDVNNCLPVLPIRSIRSSGGGVYGKKQGRAVAANLERCVRYQVCFISRWGLSCHHCLQWLTSFFL